VAPPPPLQDDDAGDQRGIDEQIRGVPERRERHLAVQQQRVAVRVQVAQPEEHEADCHE
jgi:hypothetical protein